jgi:hypothetical protein
MLLASYMPGLIGFPGKQLRYASPISVEEAIRIAVSVQEAKRQEFNNSFYARNYSRKYDDSDKSRYAVGTSTASQAEGQRKESSTDCQQRNSLEH